MRNPLVQDYCQQWGWAASPTQAALSTSQPPTTTVTVQLDRPAELTGLLDCCTDRGWRNGWLPCLCPWHTLISLATERELPVLPQVAVCGGGGGGGGGRAACAPRPGWRGCALNALLWLPGLALDPALYRAANRASWLEKV